MPWSVPICRVLPRLAPAPRSSRDHLRKPSPGSLWHAATVSEDGHMATALNRKKPCPEGQGSAAHWQLSLIGCNSLAGSAYPSLPRSIWIHSTAAAALRLPSRRTRRADPTGTDHQSRPANRPHHAIPDERTIFCSACALSRSPAAALAP